MVSADTDGHQCHRVIAKNIDHLHRNFVPTGHLVGVWRGGEFEFAVLPRAEALHYDRLGGEQPELRA